MLGIKASGLVHTRQALYHELYAQPSIYIFKNLIQVQFFRQIHFICYKTKEQKLRIR